jgi:hypothetical protein
MNKLEQKYFPLVEALLETKLTQPDFCKLHKIPIQTLYYWRKKYFASNKSNGSKSKNGFSELKINSSPLSTVEPITINYPDGTSLVCSVSLSMEELKQLIPHFTL